MNWTTMAQREPRLRHIEASCRRCRQQTGSSWFDFWSTHLPDLQRCVGYLAECPGLRSDRCFKVAQKHLVSIWFRAMAGPPAVLPWDSRPVFEEPNP